jgi:hypothetical protein
MIYNDLSEVLDFVRQEFPKGTNLREELKRVPPPFKCDPNTSNKWKGHYTEWRINRKTPNNDTEKDIANICDIKHNEVPRLESGKYSTPNNMRIGTQTPEDFMAQSWGQSGVKSKLKATVILFTNKDDEVIGSNAWTPSYQELRDMKEDYEMYKSIADWRDFWSSWHSVLSRSFRIIRLGVNGEGKSWWLSKAISRAMFAGAR